MTREKFQKNPILFEGNEEKLSKIIFQYISSNIEQWKLADCVYDCDAYEKNLYRVGAWIAQVLSDKGELNAGLNFWRSDLYERNISLEETLRDLGNLLREMMRYAFAPEGNQMDGFDPTYDSRRALYAVLDQRFDSQKEENYDLAA